jgi:hypothetical protein
MGVFVLLYGELGSLFGDGAWVRSVLTYVRA